MVSATPQCCRRSAKAAADDTEVNRRDVEIGISCNFRMSQNSLRICFHLRNVFSWIKNVLKLFLNGKDRSSTEAMQKQMVSGIWLSSQFGELYGSENPSDGGHRYCLLRAFIQCQASYMGCYLVYFHIHLAEGSYPHFKGEDREAKRDAVTCLRLLSYKVAGLGFETQVWLVLSAAGT